MPFDGDTKLQHLAATLCINFIITFSLFSPIVSDGDRKFYNIGPCTTTCKCTKHFLLDH
jgi:hypothetical protein